MACPSVVMEAVAGAREPKALRQSSAAAMAWRSGGVGKGKLMTWVGAATTQAQQKTVAQLTD